MRDPSDENHPGHYKRSRRACRNLIQFGNAEECERGVSLSRAFFGGRRERQYVLRSVRTCDEENQRF